MLMFILLTVALMRIEPPRVRADVACEVKKTNIFCLNELLLPAGARVVTADAVVCSGPGFTVVANGP